YYIDKTSYLPIIENTGDYLFFIRPRRFGKSLFLSMMKYYYDVFYKNQFEKLFKGTWILNNATRKRGRYLVLSLNFSEVTPAVDKLEDSFLTLVKGNALAFTRKYRSWLAASEVVEEYGNAIKACGSASDILGHLNRLVAESQQKMIVIIDEYDKFSNTLLTESGDAAYHGLTHGDGFLRTFFNVLKAGTGEAIARLFITGVSPVTMDDVTSGFNIGENASLSSKLDKMLGFTEAEVKDMIDYYKKAAPILKSTPQLMEMLGQWYGN
ncbi:MAG: AAA family ATPase, partial [bacterium]|nr:AAA family ATPase [bacterium]